MFPLIADPRVSLFRRMLALSVGLHVAAVILAPALTSVVGPRPRISTVAVVDLVGFVPRAEPQGSAGTAAAAAPAVKAAPPAKAMPQPKSSRQQAPAPAPAPKARAKAVTPPVNEGRDLSDAIRKMREKKEEEESVGEAISTLRKTMEARAAVGTIRERQARRVDLTALSRGPAGSAPSTLPGAGGGAGRARVSPEDLAYYRALDERIRSHWILPAASPEDYRRLMVQLRIVIGKDGRVKERDIVVEKPSGKSFFDDSVIRAILRASPLPVPPETLRGGEDRYEVGFRFFGGDEAS